MRRQKTRLEQLLEQPTLSESVDEDRMIVWVLPLSMTDEGRDAMCALLAFDEIESCARNRARWAEIAEEARRTGRSRDQAADVAIAGVTDV